MTARTRPSFSVSSARRASSTGKTASAPCPLDSLPVPAATVQEGRTQIAALVERFLANERYYTSHDFDETSTREQFINGFFDALGWDVLDAAGLGPDREVVFHPRLRDE